MLGFKSAIFGILAHLSDHSAKSHKCASNVGDVDAGGKNEGGPKEIFATTAVFCKDGSMGAV
jgi:hypothetical protein